MLKFFKWLGGRSHFFTLAYPVFSPILAPVPILAFLARRREVSAALHLAALPLLPWPWNYVLAPYATLFLFTVPFSTYGPYLAAAYLLSVPVWGLVNPLLTPLAAAGAWWAFWKARHLATPLLVEASPPTLVAGEVGVWPVKIRACCKFLAWSEELALVEQVGDGVLETEARGAFKVGGVYTPGVKLLLSDPLAVVRTVRTAAHPPITVIPRAKMALEAYAQRGVEPVEYEGLREYVPGDNPRLIHWRRSLALERLVVKVFSTAGRYGNVVLVPFARTAEVADRLAEAAIYSSLAAGAPVYLYDFRELKKVEKMEEVVASVVVVGLFSTAPSECAEEPRGLPEDALVVADKPYASCFKNHVVYTPENA
ncbi:MAG: DUF58 domain-containing protein [Pyrobaculum sp.]